ncbi:hypothetical protein L7F22_034914 [Adiantum nelumboides]|nr:hypothetical protein [Adiantum nelumboides]
MLLAFDTLLEKHAADLVALLGAETGKPTWEAEAEVNYARTYSWWYVGEVERSGAGTTVPSATEPAGVQTFLTIKQPIGPVALLLPWNFPIVLCVRKVVSALAAGCTCVIKPSPETVLCTLAVVRLLERAGFAGGIVNCVIASNDTTPEVGKKLCEDARIKKVSFTGSTSVGRLIMAQCAPRLKKLTLELGGLGCLIVFGDADLQLALDGLIANRLRHAGQTCVAAQRVFVHASVFDDFLALLVRQVQERIDKQALGPLQTARGADKARRHIDDAVRHGATRIEFCSSARTHASQAGGFFVAPVVLTGCTRDMLVYQEESFAPLFCLSTFDTEQQVLARANDETDMGLSSFVYSRDHDRLWRMYEGLNVGNVGFNTANTTSTEIPFGGLNQSGLGKEGGIGAGMDEYLVTKSATVRRT